MDGFIIIVARNNMLLTRLAVDSALAQDMPATVCVVDNASSDNTPRYVASKHGVVSTTYVQQQSLAGCWNDMLKIAWRLGHQHALVINNDVELRPDTYIGLLTHGGPFVTCVSVDDRARLRYPEPDPEIVLSERPHPDFSCFLIRKAVTDKVGWFDEDMYPAYCEDCDYHVRMHRAGITAVCIDLPFLHHGASTLSSASLPDRRKIERGAQRNRERFRVKYGCLPGTPEYNALFEGE